MNKGKTESGKETIRTVAGQNSRPCPAGNLQSGNFLFSTGSPVQPLTTT